MPTVWCVVLVTAAMLGSVLAYFFSLIAAFATIVTFMALLIGVFDNSTFEKKLRHYPSPIIEPPVASAPPNQEPHIPNSEPHHTLFALGTIEGTPPKHLSAHDRNTKDSHAASVAKTDAANRMPGPKIKPERLAHRHQPALARQHQNYEGRGYAMTLGHSQGYSPGLDAQR